MRNDWQWSCKNAKKQCEDLEKYINEIHLRQAVKLKIKLSGGCNKCDQFGESCVIGAPGTEFTDDKIEVGLDRLNSISDASPNEVGVSLRERLKDRH